MVVLMVTFYFVVSSVPMVCDWLVIAYCALLLFIVVSLRFCMFGYRCFVICCLG